MDWIFTLAFVGALGSGLMAGMFYVFSFCIMPALGRLSPESGIRAMQAINITVIVPIFLGVFLGMAVLGLAAGVTAGCTADSYCPRGHITRAQMATFLVRALPGVEPVGGQQFSDVHEIHAYTR
jgi:hypothetical protein